MIPVFITTLLLAPAVCGWGTLVLGRLHTDAALAPSLAGFLGLFVLSIVGTAVSLATPISPAVALATACAGYVLLGLRWRSVLGSAGLRHVSLLVGVAALGAALTQNPGRHYDTGLYHLQAVKWLTEFGPTYGLASLHVRLGFDSAWAPLAAVLEIPGLAGRSAFVLSGLPILFGASAAIVGVERAAQEPTFEPLLLASIAVPTLLALGSLGSLYVDYPVLIVGYVGLVSVILARRDPDLATVAMLLGVFCFTVKLSAVVLTAGLFAGALVARRSWRGAAWAATATAAWVARGVALSGCIGYPSTSFCFDVPWQTPEAIGVEVAEVIRSWARQPHVAPEVVLAGWDWLGPWARQQSRFPSTWIIVGALVAGAAGAVRHARTAPASVWFALALSAAGSVFWFTSAPDPRFGLLYLLAGPLVVMSHDAAQRPKRRLALTAVATAALTAGAALLSLAATFPFDVSVVSWPAFPEPRTTAAQTSADQHVSIPVHGDQCWGAPLPCTPRALPGLTLGGNTFTVGQDRRRAEH